jgi:hypothetical protein
MTRRVTVEVFDPASTRVFMERSDYFDVPTYKILPYIRGAGLLKG